MQLHAKCSQFRCKHISPYNQYIHRPNCFSRPNAKKKTCKKAKSISKVFKMQLQMFFFISIFTGGKQVFDQGVYDSTGTQSTANIKSNAATQNTTCTEQKKKYKRTENESALYQLLFDILGTLIETCSLGLDHTKATKILPIPYSHIDRQTWYCYLRKKKRGESKRRRRRK